ncbi:MAG: D-alanine--D-alanine ligase [Prolixibacteraceae bacterium]|nr:D-alanine--D-alanine ligase [Prolixibacteraceae bacterium]
MKPNIAVITGGDSSEFIVSVKSGANVFQSIDKNLFCPWLVRMQEKTWQVLFEDGSVADIDKSDFSFFNRGEKVSFDFAYITIHGTPGENGILQAYFELLKIPYSSCNVGASALTFDKWRCSHFLRSFGITMARSVKLNKGEKPDTEKLIEWLGLPLFVKPNAGGSSFGITKVKAETQLQEAIERAWNESHEALVEEFIEGTEYTCGLTRIGTEITIFPVTEVIPRNEFFDFEAKYQGASEEITPARLPAHLFEECQQLSRRIYDLCGCDGIVRVDYILHNNKFYFLEINTTPGMTSASFIPQQINAMGKELSEILTGVINTKLESYKHSC